MTESAALALEVLRHFGDGARKKAGLTGVAFSIELRDVFEEAIHGSFYDELYIHEDRDLSQTKEAERYGVNRSTLFRWKKRETEPSYRQSCMIAAANDVRYPRGVAAALAGYCAAIDFIERKLRMSHREVRVHGS